MFPQYEFNDTTLMIFYILMAIVIPAIAVLGDDAKMRNR